MSKGKLKSIVDSVYTFEDAAEAHTKMLKGNLFGKILMKPA
jgi:NADPH:quinone reductase-like Zn-dependent oxidoreductase